MKRRWPFSYCDRNPINQAVSPLIRRLTLPPPSIGPPLYCLPAAPPLITPPRSEKILALEASFVAILQMILPGQLLLQHSASDLQGIHRGFSEQIPSLPPPLVLSSTGDGASDGASDGALDGAPDGAPDGASNGAAVGGTIGALVGETTGALVGGGVLVFPLQTHYIDDHRAS
jgi:hypothetical protein